MIYALLHFDRESPFVVCDRLQPLLHVSADLRVLILDTVAISDVGFSRLGAGLSLLLAVNLIGNILPRLPGLEILRDFGMVTYATLLVWFGAVFAIRKTKKAVAGIG